MDNINIINRLKNDPITTCCFSGHRIISKDDTKILPKNIDTIINRLYNQGFRTFISGGALGFDTLAADAIIKYREAHNDIRLVMALPCRNQASKWARAHQNKYKSILSLADEVIYVSENFTNRCMHKRNEFMVDNSMALVAYIKYPSGGTAYTISYAIDKGNSEIINILDI